MNSVQQSSYNSIQEEGDVPFVCNVKTVENIEYGNGVPQPVRVTNVDKEVVVNRDVAPSISERESKGLYIEKLQEMQNSTVLKQIKQKEIVNIFVLQNNRE